MCGIVGFMPICENSQDLLEKMMNRIIHRGPDGEGIFIDDMIALGHRRLSIIDLQGGHQPMETNHLVVVFNGEIYNYKELRKELEKLGHRFITKSDTEVLIHGYEEYQYNIVHHLRGMFAFALYDKTKQELFCARDHFGIKPFYYYHKNKHFLFGSEIKAFLDHPYFDKEFNKDVLDIYLRMNYVCNEDTFFKDVKQLLPGHYLIYKNHNIQIQSYFQVSFQQNNKHTVEDIDNVMKDSIQHHLLADVEVGSFLSSGIDSSYLVSLARPQHTYTVGYSDERYNEIEYAKDLTQQLGIENKSKIITLDDYLKVIPTIMYHLDEPTADPAAVALYFVSELASQDVKVVLSGEGADEFFGGYNTYRSDIDSRIYHRIPFLLRYIIAKITQHIPFLKNYSFFIRNGEKIENYYIGVNPVFSTLECQHLLKNPKTIHTHKDMVGYLFHNDSHYTNIQKKQFIDIQTWFVKDILQKGDKMTMAHSIESRVPFTDYEVFKLARGLSDEQKVTTDNTKVLLRKAAKHVILNDAYKKKKLGFPVPLREWLKEDKFYQEVYKAFQTPFIKEYFHQDQLLKMLEKHQNNKQDNYKKIWTVYCLSIWYQVFFDDNHK